MAEEKQIAFDFGIAAADIKDAAVTSSENEKRPISTLFSCYCGIRCTDCIYFRFFIRFNGRDFLGGTLTVKREQLIKYRFVFDKANFNFQ